MFYFTQSVWRKIQHLGLQVAYGKQRATFNFCRRLMALAFLPAEYIPAQFAAIKRTINPPPVITQLLGYFETQWMQNTTFTIPSWSVYGRPIRTNNDLEGWHKLNLYLLIQILHKEARNIRLQAILISNGTVIRYQCKPRPLSSRHGNNFRMETYLPSSF